MRVTNINSSTAASILGINADSTFQQVTLGSIMSLVNDELKAALVSSVLSFGFADIDVQGLIII